MRRVLVVGGGAAGMAAAVAAAEQGVHISIYWKNCRDPAKSCWPQAAAAAT